MGLGVFNLIKIKKIKKASGFWKRENVAKTLALDFFLVRIFFYLFFPSFQQKIIFNKYFNCLLIKFLDLTQMKFLIIIRNFNLLKPKYTWLNK